MHIVSGQIEGKCSQMAVVFYDVQQYHERVSSLFITVRRFSHDVITLDVDRDVSTDFK